MSNIPHGGKLQNLIARDEDKRAALKLEALTLPSLTLTERQLCDLELIMNGGFSPLTGFMDNEDYDSVLTSMRLKSGALWSMPIYLDISQELVTKNVIKAGSRVALRDPRDDLPLAILTVKSVYKPDMKREAELVFGADDRAHPSVAYLHDQVKDTYLGGEIEAISLPAYYDYQAIRCDIKI